MRYRIASLFLSLATVLLLAGCFGGKSSPLAPPPHGNLEQVDPNEKSEVSLAAKVAPGIPVTVTVRVLRGDRAFQHITGFQFEMRRSAIFSQDGFPFQCRTNPTTGIGVVEIRNLDRRFTSAGGYYIAHVIDPVSGDTLGVQGSIPVASNAMYLECVFSEKGEFVVIRPYTPEVAINIAKNTAMADASQNSTTAVLGATSVKVGSAVLSVDKNGDYYFSAMTLVSNLPPGVLGRSFRNLKVMFGSTQIGVTWGTLNDAPINFQFGHSALLAAGTQMVVDFYADVSSDVSAEDLAAINNNPDGILRLLPVKATNMASGAEIQSLGEVRLQRLYLLSHGSLETKTKPLPSYVLAAGASSQVVLCRFSQTASVAEDMARSSFWVNILSGQSFLQQNWHWYINGTRMSPTEYTLQFFPEAGSIATIFNNDLIFARGTETEFELRDDTVVTPDAMVQNKGKWELMARLLPGTAVGMTSAVGVAVQGGDPQTHVK